MNLPNGTLLQGGKYRIEGVLGQGGFGITYLATHTALGSRVAIKEYFDSKVNNRGSDGKSVMVSIEANRAAFDAQRAKFCKEAQRMQALDCEHIAKVWDFFDENGTAYYVMEYIDVGSLEQQLRQRGKFSEAEVRDVLGQMLKALKAIHSRHMWHLDIKPGNIMCGSSGRLKLIDFGASKLVDPGAPTSTSSAIALTPGFAPLEQIAGNMSAFGPWTDFYSLGATLYVLLTGNHPPMVDQIQAEGKSAFLWPASMRDTDLRRMVEWMMSPSRHDRPQSVAEIRNKLQSRSPAQDPPQPLPPPAPTPEFHVEQSNTPWGWIVAVVLAVVLAVVGMTKCGGPAESIYPEAVDSLGMVVEEATEVIDSGYYPEADPSPVVVEEYPVYDSVPDYWSFSGTIGSYRVNGSLEVVNNNDVRGQYGYNGKSSGLTIVGTNSNFTRFKANEYNRNGECSGTYDGVWDRRSNTVSGTFTNYKYEQFHFVWHLR